MRRGGGGKLGLFALRLTEVLAVLEGFLRAAPSAAGMDVFGDWSPPQMRGPCRRALATIEHPTLDVDESHAKTVNEATNRAILECLTQQRYA